MAGYSPKKDAAADFFPLNFILFDRVAGYSPKKNAAAPENCEKIPLFICF
jgi:hypothetical protein